MFLFFPWGCKNKDLTRVGQKTFIKNVTNEKIIYRTPQEVHDSAQFQQEIFEKYMRRALAIKKKKKQKIKYKIGQMVRVQYSKNKMTRSYNEQTGSQRYKIRSIDTKARLYPLYFLEDERGTLIKGGGFLQSQLVPIDLGDKYRGHVLKTSKKDNKKYVTMRFKGYNSDWDEVVPV